MTEATFDSLLDLRRQFLRFLERRVRDRAVAEDILQTAYTRALEAGGQLRARILGGLVLSHLAQRGYRLLSPPRD